MKILVVEPGKHPYEKEIEGTLKEMQKIVGGRIQALYPFRDEVGVVCNDDGISLQNVTYSARSSSAGWGWRISPPCRKT